MTGAVAPAAHPEVRCDKRTNIFLCATLRFDGRVAPVRVRDLSPDGALIEGDVLPERETKVTLERGSVFADATVAWRSATRFGLHFCVPLPVAAWWPGREVPRTQVDVDWTVAEVRAEMAAAQSAPAPRNDRADCALERLLAPPPDPAVILPQRIAEEFAFVVRTLRGLGEELSLESVVAARHDAKLKLLNRTATLIAQLALLQQAANPMGALNRIGDDDLRRRLLRGRL